MGRVRGDLECGATWDAAPPASSVSGRCGRSHRRRPGGSPRRRCSASCRPRPRGGRRRRCGGRRALGHVLGHRDAAVVLDGAIGVGRDEPPEAQAAAGAGVARRGERDVDGAEVGQTLAQRGSRRGARSCPCTSPVVTCSGPIRPADGTEGEETHRRRPDGAPGRAGGEPPGTCRASSKDPSTPWRARDRSDDQPARVGIAFPASRPVRRCVAGRERHPHPDATGLRRRRVPDALPGQLEALPLLPDVGVRGPEEPDDVVEHRTHGTGPHMEHHASVPAKDSPAPPHRGRPGSTDRPPNGDRTGRLARPVLSVTLWS